MISRPIARAASFSMVMAVVAALPAAAQIGPFAIGVKAGTLGFGAEAALHLAGPLAVRANYTGYTINQNSNIKGIAYAIKAKLSGASVILDLHPTKGAFRLSAGMVFNTPKFTLDATNPGTMTIGHTAYNSSQVSHLQGAVAIKSSAPYFGLGFDKAVFTKGRVAFGFDLGILMWGVPSPSLTRTGNTTLTGASLAQLNTDIATAVADVRSKIDSIPTKLKYWPVLGFSLKVRM